MKIPAITFIVASLILCGCQSAPERRHKVACQPVPNQNVSFDFTKHYGLICRDGSKYSGCKIIGYTGKAVRGASGYISDGYGFGHWLVIELPDGRRVFISPNFIDYIEEGK